MLFDWLYNRTRSLWLLTLLVGLAACSGGGGSGGGASAGGGAGTDGANGGDVAQPDQSQQPAVQLNLSIDRSQVAAGDSVTLQWQAANASSCEASGGWTGVRPLSGAATVGPIEDTTTFTLSCSGASGGIVRRVTVGVDDDDGTADVAVTLSAQPEIVASGGSVTLSWSSENANSCSASGAWSGPQPLSGQAVLGPIDSNRTFQIQCEGGAATAMAAVAVRIGDKTLRWQAPTQNVDGSPLNDLAGYRIYWGVASRSYSGSYTVNSPDITSWEADIGPGEFFFALTAFDAEGNESGYSNEVLKLIP